MKKLLLTLTLLAGISSSHGMEAPKQQVDSSIDYSKLFPITLPQIYHYFSENMNSDIAQYIFELQPGTSQINDDIPFVKDTNNFYKPYNIDRNIDLNLLSLGYCLTFEQLNRNLLRKKMSICDIKNENESTLLYEAVRYNLKYTNTKLYLHVAGNDVTKLLTNQTKILGWTALHSVAVEGCIEFVKLLLDVAGNNAQALIEIVDEEQETAFDVATPEVQEVMHQYLQK